MQSQRDRVTAAQKWAADRRAVWSMYRPATAAVAAQRRTQPAEGWLSPAEDGRYRDPLGIARLRHDVAIGSADGPSTMTAMDVVVQRQAHALRAVLRQPEMVLNQAERIEVADGHMRVVNKVCTVTIRRIDRDKGERSLDVDEESECAPTLKSTTSPQEVMRMAKAARRASRGRLQLRTVEHEWEDMLVMEERASTLLPTMRLVTAPTAAATAAPPPPCMSIRGMQRRWLNLGYNKNSVGTALSLHYKQPWSSTHLMFPARRRLFTVGANNRTYDRGLVKHVTLPYVYQPLHSMEAAAMEPCRYAAVQRVSQNIVASMRLRTDQEICLGLVVGRLQGVDRDGKPLVKFPAEFKNIVLAHPTIRAWLLVYRSNIICVGTSSMASLVETYNYFLPILNECRNTAANRALEKDYIFQGVIDPHDAQQTFNYQVTLDPVTGQVTHVQRIGEEEMDLDVEAITRAVEERAGAAGTKKRKRRASRARTQEEPAAKRARIAVV